MPNPFESIPTPTQETKKPEPDRELASLNSRYFSGKERDLDENLAGESDPKEKESLQLYKDKLKHISGQLHKVFVNSERRFRPEDVIDGIYGIAHLYQHDLGILCAVEGDNNRSFVEENRNQCEQSRRIFMSIGERVYPETDVSNVAHALYKVNQLLNANTIHSADAIGFHRREETQLLFNGNPKQLLQSVDNVIHSVGSKGLFGIVEDVDETLYSPEEDPKLEEKKAIAQSLYILERVREKLQEKISSRLESEKKFDGSSAPAVTKEGGKTDNMEQDPLLSLIDKAANEEVAYQYKLASEKEGVVQMTPIAWTYDALVKAYNGDIQQVGRRIREFRDFVAHKKTELLALGKDEAGASFFASKEAFKQLTSKEIQALDEVIAAEVQKQKRRTGGSAFHPSRELLFSKFLSAACSI